MPKGFVLEINPSVYIAKYQGEDKWHEEFIEKAHLSKSEEAALSQEECRKLISKRYYSIRDGLF